MKLLTINNEDTSRSVQRIVSDHDLPLMSGVELAALMFPEPTDTEVATINNFLSKGDQHEHAH